jgi:ABC-type transporter Mla subunit MlaD
VDVQTIDSNYQALEQKSQATVQALTAVAAKIQNAAKAGDPNAREWLLDLKEVALNLRDEQGQVKELLQALHAFVEGQVEADRQYREQLAQAQQQVHLAQNQAQAAQSQAQAAQSQAQQAQAAQAEQQSLQAQGYATPANTPPVQYQQPPQVQYIQAPPPPPVQYVAPPPAYYPPPAYPAYGGGYFGGGFLNSGFGQAMMMGAGFGLAENIIDDLFWY